MPWQCSLSFVPIELEHYFGFIYSRKANLCYLIMAIILAPRQEFISLEDSAFRSFLSKGFFSIRTIVASDPMFSKCVRWSTEEASANEGRCHLWNKRVWGYMKLLSEAKHHTDTLKKCTLDEAQCWATCPTWTRSWVQSPATQENQYFLPLKPNNWPSVYRIGRFHLRSRGKFRKICLQDSRREKWPHTLLWLCPAQVWRVWGGPAHFKNTTNCLFLLMLSRDSSQGECSNKTSVTILWQTGIKDRRRAPASSCGKVSHATPQQTQKSWLLAETYFRCIFGMNSCFESTSQPTDIVHKPQ